MSISGYFAKYTAELRMPRTPDPLGISFEGLVLTGQRSLQQQHRDEAIRASITARERYKAVDENDFVAGHPSFLESRQAGPSGPPVRPVKKAEAYYAAAGRRKR